METYLIKSGICLLVFLSFYKVILEGISAHVFKRIFLLSALAASFTIPLLTFTTYVDEFSPLQYDSGIIITSTSESLWNWKAQLPYVVGIVYALGVLFFSLKFFHNLYNLYRKIHVNQKYRKNGIVNVLLEEEVIPHTFFHFIFFNKTRFINHDIPSEIVLHEETHAKQKHSLDVLFIEILSIVFWFNPLLKVWKHCIKLNHEFLADQAVLKYGIERVVYQKTLLAFSSNAKTPILANSINYSFIKKRFTVMKSHTSKKTNWLRGLLVLPLVLISVYSFSGREKALLSEKENAKIIAVQETSATRSEMKEYTELAKKYNAQPKESRVIILKELKRLEFIYKKMSEKQRLNAEPFPECIPPPPNAPKVKEGDMMNKDVVPPPPPPIPPLPATDPAKSLIELAKNGAVFYLDKKKIDSEEAIKLLRSNSKLRVEIINSDTDDTIVHLSSC